MNEIWGSTKPGSDAPSSEPKIHAVTMPRWGLAMTEGKVSAWHVAVGGAVKKGQDVLDIETEKIANAHESPAAGVLRRQLLNPGDVAPVGALLAVVADAGVPDAEIDAFVSGYKVPVSESGGDAGAPRPKQIEAGGTNWNYLDIGNADGPVVVLVHGFGGDLNNWMFVWPALEATSRIIAVDLPGHGASGKTSPVRKVDDLAKGLGHFLDAIGVSEAHLIGHSLGGAVAALTALARRDLALSVTLIASLGLGEEIDDSYLEGFILAERRKDLQAVVGHLFADQAQVSRELVEGLLRFKRIDGVKDGLVALRAAMVANGRQAVSLLPELVKLDTPMTVIWGGDDRIIPATHASGLPSSFAVHLFPGAGHMVHMERAKEINAILAAVVASL